MTFLGAETCALCGDNRKNIQFSTNRHTCTIGMLRLKWRGTVIPYIAFGFILFCLSAILALSIWNWTKLPLKFEPECFCGDENFCIPPLLSLYPVIQRKFFNCSLGEYVQKFGLLSTAYSPNVTEFEVDKLVFVTATSSNHFTLVRGLIQNLRQFHPINKIVFYDLGLSDAERDEIKHLCKVEYVRFPFESYPPHVQDLMNYAWKVMILAEQHRLGRPFIYMDASVRLTSLYIPERIFELAKAGQIEPYTMLQHVYHSIKATTAPGFYDYIPMPDKIIQTYRMDSAGIQLVMPSNYTRAVMKWQVLCALTPDCIAPPGHQVKCVFEDTDRFLNYHNCHRYDQTLLNSLVARMLFGNDNYALHFNYTYQATPLHSRYAVKKAFKRRKARYREVNQMFRLDRDDIVHEPVQMPCTIEQELLAALR